MEVVSICIPNYNYSRFIARCIESVLEQTYSNLEIIISDNCSTDDSDLVIQKFKDKRIRYFRQSQNIEMMGNFDFCISQSQGTYILVLSSDDYIKPNIVEKCVSVLRSDSEIAFCHTAVETFNDKGRIVGVTGAFTRSYIRSGKSIISEYLQGKRACLSATVFRRDCFERIGGWSKKYRYLGDIDIWFRMLLHWKVGYVGEILTGFRSHDISETAILEKVGEDLEFIDDMFSQLPESLHYLHALYPKLQAKNQQIVFDTLMRLPESTAKTQKISSLKADFIFKNKSREGIYQQLITQYYYCYTRNKICQLLIQIHPSWRYILGDINDKLRYKYVMSE
jgi:glycosyltransferase involved in cell wall biosynthesis